MMRSRLAGTSGCECAIGRGSAFMIAPMRLAWLLPSNAFLPVSIS